MLPVLKQPWDDGRGVICGLMLTSGRGLFARVIQAASRSRINHVGCAVRGPDGWSVLESTTHGPGPGGVQMNPLAEIAAEKRHTVWVRPVWLPGPVTGMRRDEAWELTRELFAAWDDRPYEKSVLELARSAIDLGIPQVGDDASLFCSELAAHWLFALGVLDPDAKPAAEYTPADFGEERSQPWLLEPPRYLVRVG